MFKTGNNGVFSVDHPCSGRRMMGYPLQGIRLVPIGTRAKVRVRILHKGFQIGFVKCFDPCGQRAVTQNENRGAEFAGDPRSFQRDVEAILDRGSRKHNPWTVAVAAENRLVKVALFHIGWQTCARYYTLDIYYNERDLRNRRPTDRLGLKRNARSGAPRYRKIAGI